MRMMGVGPESIAPFIHLPLSQNLFFLPFFAFGGAMLRFYNSMPIFVALFLEKDEV